MRGGVFIVSNEQLFCSRKGDLDDHPFLFSEIELGQRLYRLYEVGEKYGIIPLCQKELVA